MYRIGIVGAGGIAGMHARAIAEIQNAELVGVADRAKPAAERYAGEHGGKAFDDLERMLDELKPDMVCVCTPSGVHAQAAMVALERGVAVLCEKPMEINLERIDQMLELAEAKGALLGGIFMQRYNPVIQAIYAAVKEKRFGELATVNGYVPWWRDDAYYGPDRWQGKLAMDGGGAMMNQSIHVVDMVQWFAGAGMQGLEHRENPVEQVFAYTGKRGHDPELIEVEDTAVVSLRFRDGTLGQLLGTTSMYPGSLRRLQIGGRNGMAETLEDELVTWAFREPRAEDEAIREKFGRSSATSGGASDPMAIDYVNHRRNIEAFLEALDKGGQFMLDGWEARKAVAILEAVYESARTGQAVNVR